MLEAHCYILSCEAHLVSRRSRFLRRMGPEDRGAHALSWDLAVRHLIACLWTFKPKEDALELSMDKGNQFVQEPPSPEGSAAWKQQLDPYAPGASDWVVGAVFGGTYQREGLELRDRQMLNMAALAAMGGTEPQLTGHIKTAVEVAGMSKEEVAECFVHLMPYIGVPKTLAAMRCMQTAFASK